MNVQSDEALEAYLGLRNQQYQNTVFGFRNPVTATGRLTERLGCFLLKWLVNIAETDNAARQDSDISERILDEKK